MAKLGYTMDIGKLNSFKAHCFMVISSEIEKIKETERKKTKKTAEALNG